MDFQKLFLNSNYKSKMGAHIPQSHAFGAYTFAGQSAGLHSFAKGANMPHKSFSYPDCYSKFSPQNLFDSAVEMTRKLPNGTGMNNFAPRLTQIVNEVLTPNPLWNTAKKVISDNLYNVIEKEITRTMSCPEAFSCRPPETRSESPRGESLKQDFTKMSYADAAKMNLSNLNKNNMNVNKPLDSNTLSSHRNNIFGVKKDKKVSSPPPYEYVNRNYGTNSTRGDQLPHKNKYHHKNTRRPNKKMHPSLKRELGTKKNNQNMDLDGSMWGRENVRTFEDSPSCTDIPHAPLIRVRSISSESDCSSEISECLKNPRVRSISECSVNSVDSDDSFIVFDDCIDCDDGMYDSYEGESSEEDDECSPVIGSCNGLQQSDYLKCINSKWNNLSPNNIVSYSSNDLKNNSQNNCPLSPALKKVRFACGEALAKVRKLCVWDFAHRAARIGPWEQAARDRSRFSSRVLSLAPILNPILDPTHRTKIYDLRFAST